MRDIIKQPVYKYFESAKRESENKGWSVVFLKRYNIPNLSSTKKVIIPN